MTEVNPNSNGRKAIMIILVNGTLLLAEDGWEEFTVI
jgi:hypothetical protein